MLSFADVMYFFADEFSGLRRGTLALARVFPCTVQRFLIWHLR